MQTKIQHVTDIPKFKSIKLITFIALGVLISYYLARGYLILINAKAILFLIYMQKNSTQLAIGFRYLEANRKLNEESSNLNMYIKL